LKFVSKLGFLLVLVALGGAAWFWYCLEEPYQGFSAQGVFVTVPRGASGRTVARVLKQNGVLRSSFAFGLYARRHPKRRLQAGEYFFDHAISGHDVFWQIADGHVYQQAFTVREGETIFDIAQDLAAQKLVTAEDFLAAAENPELIHDIAPHAKTLEGFLFPATYYLPRHPVATDVIAEMVHKFKEEWQRIGASQTAGDPTGLEHGRPTESVVTLASLVERETPKREERPLVAGTFANRLRKHIPLQCDPTVIYALQDAGQYRGSLTLADLRFDSPYNTYAHSGLPPGPIGNPGEASLRAALNPAETNYLYFVANTQGGHFFATNLIDHNRNVNRYHRLLAGLPADPPESEESAAQSEQSAPKPAPPTSQTAKRHHSKHSSPSKKPVAKRTKATTQ
jgi:peptidoglycan lytic transglycosylase G